MKFLLLTLMIFLTGLTPVQENKQTFEQTVKEGYESYMVVTDEETLKYGIEIVLGKTTKDEKSMVTYSILFTSVESKEFNLAFKFKGDNVYRQSKPNGRGDYFVYGIMPSQDLEVVVRNKEADTNSYTINYVDNETYEKLDNSQKLVGENKGITSTKIKTVGVKSLTFTLSIVFGSIILVSIIVIVILSLTKKGLFSRQKMDQEIRDDFNYEEFVKNAMNQARQAQNNYNNQNPFPQNVKNPIEVEAEEVKEEPKDKEPVQEQPKEVYEKVRDYEVESEKDVKSMLEAKGFNTDYANLSSDDKNKIMLELMRMKDFKEISESDYKNEVIKLWM